MESLGILTFKVPEENNNIESHNETPLQKQLKNKQKHWQYQVWAKTQTN